MRVRRGKMGTSEHGKIFETARRQPQHRRHPPKEGDGQGALMHDVVI